MMQLMMFIRLKLLTKDVNVLKIYEYSTLYFVQNLLPFCVIGALDSKQVLNTASIHSFMECVDIPTFLGQPVELLKMLQILVSVCTCKIYFFSFIEALDLK